MLRNIVKEKLVSPEEAEAMVFEIGESVSLSMANVEGGEYHSLKGLRSNVIYAGNSCT